MIELTFNQLFPSKFKAGFLFIVMKSIKSALELIEKFKIDEKILKRDGNRLKKIKKSQNIVTFSIYFDFFDILIDFFDLSIHSFDLLIHSYDLLIDSFDLLINSFDLLIDLYQSTLIKNRSKLYWNRDCYWNWISIVIVIWIRIVDNWISRSIWPKLT